MNTISQPEHNHCAISSSDRTFKKQHRLLNPSDFKAVFDAPIKKIHTVHLMAFVAKSSSCQPRLGLAITKKKLKRAVARNRIKRLTRETFRHHRSQLSNIDVVVIVKASYDQKFDIGQEVDELFNKIHQKFDNEK